MGLWNSVLTLLASDRGQMPVGELPTSFLTVQPLKYFHEGRVVYITLTEDWPRL
jgi:hypothetical protein